MSDKGNDEELVLICLPVELKRPDNLIGKCDKCGCFIQFRSNVPKSIKRCLSCVNLNEI